MFTILTASTADTGQLAKLGLHMNQVPPRSGPDRAPCSHEHISACNCNSTALALTAKLTKTLVHTHDCSTSDTDETMQPVLSIASWPEAGSHHSCHMHTATCTAT